MSRRNPNGRVADFILYVLIGLAVVAAAVIYASYSLRTGSSGELPLRWIGLAGATGLTFWAAVKQFRPHWSELSFWLKVTGLLAIHVLAYIVVLLKFPEWRLLWFVPPSVIEGAVLFLVLNKLVDRAR